MVEWCDCPSPDGMYGALLPVEGNHIPYAHASCGKPTFQVWQTYEDYCDECGRSFSSPYSDVCEFCSEGEYHSWWWGLLSLAAISPWSPWHDLQEVRKTLEMSC